MVLGQALPLAGVLTPLYVIPTGYAQAEIVQVLACNTNLLGSTLFSIAVGEGTGVLQEWIVYQMPMLPFDTFYWEPDEGKPITIRPPDGIYVSSLSGLVNFTLFGELK